MARFRVNNLLEEVRNRLGGMPKTLDSIGDSIRGAAQGAVGGRYDSTQMPVVRPVVQSVKDFGSSFQRFTSPTQTPVMLSKQGMKNYADTLYQGAKAGANLYGATKLTAPLLATSAVFGGVINKATGGSFKEGAIAGLNSAPAIAGIGSFTNPAISRFGQNISSKLNNPLAQNVGNRIAQGVANIPEGIVMNRGLGKTGYSLGEAALDFGTGALFAGQDRPRTKATYNPKNIDAEDMGLTDRLRDFWNSKNKDLEQVKTARDFTDKLASRYLDKKTIDNISQSTKNSQTYYKKLTDAIANKFRQSQADYGYADNLALGIKANDSGVQASKTQQPTLKIKPSDRLPKDTPQVRKDLADVMYETPEQKLLRNKKTVDSFIRGLEKDAKKMEQELKQRIKLKANRPNISTDDVSQYTGTIKGGGFTDEIDPRVRADFERWVKDRQASKIEGFSKKQDFKQYDDKGIKGILEFQKKSTKNNYKGVKQFFDSKYKELQNKGIQFGYKQDYLPQLWDNTDEEIEKAFGKSLGLKPSFTYDSVIKDYQEGINKGLKPKFETISELAGWYEQRANKALADRNYFQTLVKENVIMPKGKAPKDWRSLDPDRFPNVNVTIDGNKSYRGVFAAPEPLAKLINNYLEQPEGKLSDFANIASRAKNIVLTGGIPKTAINFHGINTLARSTLGFNNPAKGVFKAVKYLINPQAGEDYIKQNLDKATLAAKSGVIFDVEDHAFTKMSDGVRFPKISKATSKLGEIQNELFEKPLFQKMIPALKVDLFDETYNSLKKNMPEDQAKKQAAEYTNNVFGGINWEAMGRSRETNNILRSLILAPDWLETQIRLGKGIGKSLTTGIKDPSMKPYRQFARNTILAIVAANIANKITSGHYMYENEAGHTFEIEAGYTNDGKKRYIRPFGTAADFVRIPYDVAMSIAKGDVQSIFRVIGNRLSTPVATGIRVLTDTDYLGRPIGLRGKDKYGNEMDVKQRVGGIANLAIGATMPGFVRGPIDYASGRSNAEQAIAQAIEAPLRYSGGAYSNIQKQVQDRAKQENIKGKDLYNLFQDVKGETKLSDKQLEKYQGVEGVKQVLNNREKNKEKEIIKAQVRYGDDIDYKKSGNTYFYEHKTSSGDIQIREVELGKTFDRKDYASDSSYKSSITNHVNRVTDLYEKGAIDQSTAKKEAMRALEAKYALTNDDVNGQTKSGIDPRIKKYFPQDQWEIAQAVMMAESGGKPNAKGDDYPINGLYAPSYGLFQIRALEGRPDPKTLLDPEENVKYAAKLWKEQGWQPWSAYTNGNYQQYLGKGYTKFDEKLLKNQYSELGSMQNDIEKLYESGLITKEEATTMWANIETKKEKNKALQKAKKGKKLTKLTIPKVNPIRLTPIKLNFVKPKAFKKSKKKLTLSNKSRTMRIKV